MKSKSLFFLISLIFVGISFAQPHSISYKFSVEGCGEIPELELFRGIMFEGDKLFFDEYTLPSGNESPQFFYNLMVGGELGFPDGSLKENINCDIVLAGLCNLEIGNLQSENNLLKLLYLEISITGEKSGVSLPNQYYYLENDKETFIRLPLSNILPFLNFMSYSIDDFTPFYVDANSNPDLNGIRKAVEGDFLSIYARHFSTIGIGFKITDPTSVNSVNVTPVDYSLSQNFPNPFNPTTTINYSILNAGATKLAVYNSLGQEIKTLVNENQSAGSYNINFDASNLPSGMYFYTLTSGNFSKTSKMILMK